MKSKALCYFKHNGVDYRKGAAVDLPEAEIKALAKAELVEPVREAPAKETAVKKQ